MVLRLNQSDANFTTEFDTFVKAEREAAPDVAGAVADIIAQVRSQGDAALVALTEKFDRFDLNANGMKMSEQQRKDYAAQADPKAVEALQHAADRIAAYHERQKPADDMFTDAEGATLGHRWTAVQAAGLYVPGGLASYPSSVLMNAIPAKVAGVGRLAMVVPTPDGVVNPLVIAAANIAGVDEIYTIGGAQAVAALAFGTETVQPVDVITGPGNAFVAEAKRQVFGTVGIDMIAGPSEILVVADGTANADWVAADLLSQAEHDPTAQSILITDDAGFADAVVASVENYLNTLPRGEITRQSWDRFGAIILVGSVATDAGALIDRLAPEHLELCVADPEAVMQTFTNAGAIFMGHHTPEAVGDYVAGPNHVLPTARSARFSSGLSVLNFMKRTTILNCSAEALGNVGPSALKLAQSEGLPAHGLSVAVRLNIPWQSGDE